MKKKKIIVGVIVLFVIAAITVTITVLLSNRSEDSGNTEDTKHENKLYESIFEIENIEKYNELMSSIENIHYESADKLIATVYDVDSFNNRHTDFTLKFDDDKNICNIKTVLFINNLDKENGSYQSISSDELKVVVEKTMEEYCLFFGVDTVPPLYLTLNDGTFESLETAETYEKIINGEGTMTFTVRDKKGTFWTLNLYASNGTCKIEIIRNFDVEKYIDYFANISIYNSEE